MTARLRIEMLPDGRLAAGPRQLLTDSLREQLRELAELLRQARARLGWDDDRVREYLADAPVRGLTRAAAELRDLLAGRAERDVAGNAAPAAGNGRRAERQRRVRELLAEDPGRKRAVVFDPDDRRAPDVVPFTVAVRMPGGGVAVAEGTLPRSRYDPFAIVQALQAAEQ
jgi:hypothetical protein